METTGQPDRCPFVPANQMESCRAHHAVLFEPSVATGVSLSRLSTCRFLTVGADSSGRPYPRCAIGDEHAREEFVERRRRELDERVVSLLAADLSADKEEAGVMVADDEGTYVAVNRAMCHMLGYEREHALLGRSVWDLTPEPHAENGRAMWREFVAAGESYGTYLLACQDGTTRAFDYLARANVIPGLHVSILTPSSEDRTHGDPVHDKPSR